jgi:hypothetical protein
VVLHIYIGRHDQRMPRDWHTLQRIKTDLVGDRLAVEVYPAAEHVVDDANVAHLYVLPEGVDLPFCLSRGPDVLRG